LVLPECRANGSNPWPEQTMRPRDGLTNDVSAAPAVSR